MKRTLAWAFIFLAISAVIVSIIYVLDTNIAVLKPMGTIAIEQRDLFMFTMWLMLIVVIPVFILTFFFAYKYRASNNRAKYSPKWDQHRLTEAIWWAIPFAIVIVLSVVNWIKCRELDPMRPLDSEVTPLTIQVIALEWKWLFIYPEQHIATINYLRIPEKVPIHFEITSDAPMNSFWIPQLGGQIYAMPGMITQLHLIANTSGDFRGLSANLSGKGFAGMTFSVAAGSQADFDQWVESVRQSPESLSLDQYQLLSQPSEYNAPTYYILKHADLFDHIVMKFITPIP